ncbi:MAG: sensor domain-containing protein [Chloroflexota bacterium]
MIYRLQHHERPHHPPDFTAVQTFRVCLYLTITPLAGIIYAVVIAAGLALGIMLSIVTIGLPVLLGTLALIARLGARERRLAVTLLDMPIEPAYQAPPAGLGERITHLIKPATWAQPLLFLLLKLPLGLLTWVVIAVGLLCSIGLISSSATFLTGLPLPSAWGFTHPFEALIALAAGLITLPLLRRLLHVLGTFWGMLAAALLGTGEHLPLLPDVSDSATRPAPARHPVDPYL